VSLVRELESGVAMSFEEQGDGSSTDVLVGRDLELGLIARFLDRASSDGDALLMFGEPGVGKTVLLGAAADLATAAGSRVLRASGVEFEADVPYAGLHQLLLPLHQEIAELEGGQRDALNAALGFTTGSAPNRLMVSTATLVLLRRAAANRSLVAIVDDLPWFDRASALVLGFIARRLSRSRVGLLTASRPDVESFFDRAGLPQLDVGPLDNEAAIGLMGLRFPGLPRSVQDRLLTEAQGNPLALLELPTALDQPKLTPLPPVTAALPISRRLQALFASRIADVPQRTREILLLLALDGTGDLRVLHAAPERGGWLPDFAVGEEAGLVRIDATSHRPIFRHPLIRSTVVAVCGPDECRRAHEALASVWVDQPDRQAWHLGQARLEPDESVAALLEQAAHHSLRRGDGIGAVSALSRAADLSPGGADRGRRLAEAAYIGADVTGELGNASQLLADAHRADPQFSESVQAAATAAAMLLNGDGDIATAHRLLGGAVEHHASKPDVAGDAFFEALHNLLEVCLYGGQPKLWEPFDAAMARFEPELPEVLRLWSNTMADPVGRGASALKQLSESITALEDEADPTRIERIATAAIFLDRVGDCREALWRVVQDGREGRAVASAINALMLLSFDDFQAGRWDELSSLTAEGLTLCESHGYRLLTWPLRYSQALLAAARGDDATVQALGNEMNAWAMPRGVRAVQWYACHAQALAALGRGDCENAYQHATAITPAGAVANHFGQTLWIAMDLVDAAVRSGRRVEASAHLHAMHNADVAKLSPRLAFITAASGAVVAPDASAFELFERALTIDGIERWPFELARVRLAFGERLRRARAITEARVHLTDALETFERLGAQPWADRASNELRATGQTKPRGEDRDRDALTPQELEIASLAAAGLSNKEIAKRLFLSPRTVGAHLYRIFPKLGITSRAALRDALSRLPRDEHDPTELAR
jgi:DNA-binding CsgD family transcriptional regulator